MQEDITLEKTKDYLADNHFSNTEFLAGEIRKFLYILYENCLQAKRYNSPIWKGMLEIVDDWTLIKYTIVLLEHMWL